MSVLVQDTPIIRRSSLDDHNLTRGNLCITGRFGWINE